MLEHLFGSKTRIKLLRLLFRHPDKAYFVRELTRELDTQINAIRREINLLVKANIVVEIDTPEAKKDAPGGKLRKYYKLNSGSLLYPELKALLMKAKIMGEQQFVRDLQENGGKINLLMLCGHFTGNPEAPTDMLIVGNAKKKVISKAIEDYEEEFGTPVRFTFMTNEEFFDRRHIMDKFLYEIFEGKHIKVVNDLNV